MDTRQVEYVTVVLDGETRFEVGDRKTWPAAKAAEHIRLGWAKCTETGEQGELKPGAQAINIQNVIQETA